MADRNLSLSYLVNYKLISVSCKLFKEDIEVEIKEM